MKTLNRLHVDLSLRWTHVSVRTFSDLVAQAYTLLIKTFLNIFDKNRKLPDQGIAICSIYKEKKRKQRKKSKTKTQPMFVF